MVMVKAAHYIQFEEIANRHSNLDKLHRIVNGIRLGTILQTNRAFLIRNFSMVSRQILLLKNRPAN